MKKFFLACLLISSISIPAYSFNEGLEESLDQNTVQAGVTESEERPRIGPILVTSLLLDPGVYEYLFIRPYIEQVVTPNVPEDPITGLLQRPLYNTCERLEYQLNYYERNEASEVLIESVENWIEFMNCDD